MNNTLYKGIRAALVGTLAIAGCATDSAALPTGNAQLGIAEFQIDDTANQTIITTFDASHNQSGKIELIHGDYILEYAEPGSSDIGKQVSGRSREDRLRGVRLHLADPELRGTRPTCLPCRRALRPTSSRCWRGPHVKPYFDAWLIAWQPRTAAVAPAGEQPYDSSHNIATVENTRFCSSSPCPIYTGTTPICQAGSNGGYGLVWQAAIGDQGATGTYGYYGFENLISQMCYATNPEHGFFAFKTCAFSQTNGSYTSSCGSDANKCQACGQTTYSTSTGEPNLTFSDAGYLYGTDPATGLDGEAYYMIAYY